MREPSLRFTATWLPAPVLVGHELADGVKVRLTAPCGPTIDFTVGPVRWTSADGYPIREVVDPEEHAFEEATRRAERWGGRLERFARADEELPAVEVALSPAYAADLDRLPLAYRVAARRCA